jgi:hypothetical protein
MILETWIGPSFAVAESGLPTQLIKLLRLLRLTRMARLMRAFPELMAMVKGLRVASRAVGSALLMLVMLVYIFAVILFLLTKESRERTPEDPEYSKIIQDRFATLPIVMWTLIVDGTFLDGIGITSRELYQRGEYFAFICLLFFVLLAAMTVMNMLIGVLCEVVTAVAAAEKEEAAIRLVKETVLVMLKTLDEDGSGEISREEINQVFGNDTALEVLESLKVDVRHFVDHLDMYYEEAEDLTIPQIMDLILMLRGDRSLCMKDLLHEQSFNRWRLTRDMGAKMAAKTRRDEFGTIIVSDDMPMIRQSYVP